MARNVSEPNRFLAGGEFSAEWCRMKQRRDCWCVQYAGLIRRALSRRGWGQLRLNCLIESIKGTLETPEGHMCVGAGAERRLHAFTNREGLIQCHTCDAMIAGPVGGFVLSRSRRECAQPNARLNGGGRELRFK